MSYLLTDLSTLSSLATGDKIPIVDVSDTTQAATGSTKTFLVSTLSAYLASLSQTLTNKSLDFSDNAFAMTFAQLNSAVSDATLASLTGAETLTNKTIDLTDNSLSGTLSEFNAALSDGTFATLAGSETLSNKTLTTPHIDEPDIDGDADLIDSDGNITVGGSNPNRTLDITAGFLKPTTTSGCAAVTTNEAATNDIDYDSLDFSTSSDERAFANFQMPDSWDGGAIQFRFVWTAAGGSAAQTVVFELSGRSYANDEAIDQAVGTAIEVSDALIATGDIHISSWSSDVTLGGTPAAGEWVHLEVRRDVSEDNLSVDAKLIMVQLRYAVSQFSD